MDPVPELEKRRAAVLAQISQLGDFRPGSITSTQGRCGNPNCHCHQPGEPGHGPNLRLTYKVDGKTSRRASPPLPPNARPSAKWPSFAGTSN